MNQNLDPLALYLKDSPSISTVHTQYLLAISSRSVAFLLDCDETIIRIIRGSGSKHPILHSKPFAPVRFSSLYLVFSNVLQWSEERDRLSVVHIILSLDSEPVVTLGSKHIVSALTFMYASNALYPVVAKKAVKNRGSVESGDY